MTKSESYISPWWLAGSGFFGEDYLLGDNSLNGYVPGRKESLRERTIREVDGVLRLCGVKEGEIKTILDMPCGYGRHSLALAKRGHHVMGLDICKPFLEYANEYKARGGSLTFLVYDSLNMSLLKHNLPNRFDLALNMFFSFGFFEKEEDNISVMEGFYKTLKEGGKFLLHTDVSPEIIKSGNYSFHEERTLHSFHPDKQEHPDKLIIREEYDEEKKRLNGTWTIQEFTGASRTLTPYSVRIYSAQEFKDMARACGFSRVDVYGSFKGETFNPDSKEMIVVAEKIL